MRIVFLGTGGYYTNDRRHTPGILLPDVGVLLDAGIEVRGKTLRGVELPTNAV